MFSSQMSQHIKCQERIISAYDEQNNTNKMNEVTKLPMKWTALKLQIIRSQDSYSVNPAAEVNPHDL